MRLRPIVTGLLSYVPGAYQVFNKGPNLSTPAGCYGILFKHLCLMHEAGAPFAPRQLAEVGPGRSLGTGVLALLLGTERYVALDVVPFAQTGDEAQRWVDALVALLQRRAALPNADGFPSLRAFLDDTGAPRLLDDKTLTRALDPARIAAVRACLRAVKTNSPGRADGLSLEYRVPWEQIPAGDEGRIDALFSHSVMELVPDPLAAYGAMFDLLRPGGVTSHQINYDSHGMSGAWNGHWAYPDWLWRLALGRKPFLMNRLGHGSQLESMRSAGLEVVNVLTSRRSDGLPAHRLAQRYRGLGQDLTVVGAVVVARRPGN